MRKYSHETIVSLKVDRKNGMSVPELIEKYKMPKTSVWHHVKNISLSEEKHRLIFSRRGGTRAKKERDLLNAQKEAQLILNSINIKRSGILIFAALYWSEGNKKSFVFTNTDADMIKMFIRLLKKYFKVEGKDITALIRVTDHLDTKACLDHWKKITRLPAENICLNINNEQNKTKTKYGICRLTLKKGGYRLKLTNALIKNIVAQYH